MKKTILMLNFLFISLTGLKAQENIPNNSDIFLDLRNEANGLVCQGIRIENKIITSASCFCPTEEEKERIFIKNQTSVLVKSSDKTKKSFSIKVKVKRHDLACRYADLHPSTTTVNNSYDPYFFDIAVLEISKTDELLFKDPKSYPTINCHKPDHNEFIRNNTLGMISHKDSENLALGFNQFNQQNKANYWNTSLELYMTGFVRAPLSEYYAFNKKQNGSAIFSLYANLINPSYDNAKDKKMVESIVENDDLEKMNIVAIATHGKDQIVDTEQKGALAYSQIGSYGLPFYNVKNFLKKHIALDHLTVECLDGISPSGFGESARQIY